MIARRGDAYNLGQVQTHILLATVPAYTHRPYIVGISSLNDYLKTNGVKTACIDPVSEYLEAVGEKYTNFHMEELDPEYAPDPKRSEHMARLTERFLGRVGEIGPRLVGFSAIGRNRNVCLHLARACKERYPRIKTIIGGPAAESMSHDFPINLFLDYILIGEAEMGFHRLFENGAKEEDIPGLVFRDSAGKVRRNCSGSTVKLDGLNIGRHDLVFGDAFYREHYRTYVPVVLSRGCPFKCSFCTGWKVLPGYRYYPMSRCLEFLESFEGSERLVLIEDSIMNGNEGWLKQLCEGLIASKKKVRWGGVFRIHPKMVDESYFEMVARSGCIRINFGLESGSSRVLKHLKKFHNVEKMYKIFDNLRKVKKRYPIKVSVLVIVGAPLETEEDFRETMKFIYFNRDVIDQVEGCTLFNLDEELPLYQELMRDHRLVYKSGVNWATRDSSPAIRLRRGRKIAEFYKKLAIPYNLYDDGLSKIPESQLVEWVEPAASELPIKARESREAPSARARSFS